MEEGRDVLLALAQIAVALAGFSGVVTAFGRGGEFRPENRVRFLFLVIGSFVVMMLAFVPLVLAHAGFDSLAAWRLSSAIWIAAVLVALPLVLKGRRIILASGNVAPNWSIAVIALVGILALGGQVGNIGGWWWEPGPAPYISGLLAQLGGCGAIFVYLVLLRRA